MINNFWIVPAVFFTLAACGSGRSTDGKLLTIPLKNEISGSGLPVAPPESPIDNTLLYTIQTLFIFLHTVIIIGDRHNTPHIQKRSWNLSEYQIALLKNQHLKLKEV